jgi:hypothetical protein
MTKRIEEFMVQGPEELNEGECYFEISFCDTQSEIPCVETWIYVGKNLLKSDGPTDNRWYFQDPESYVQHGNFVDLAKEIEHDVVAADLDAVRGFYCFGGLREALATLKPRIVRK